MKKAVLSVMAQHHHSCQSLKLAFAEGLDGIRMLWVMRTAEEAGLVSFENVNDVLLTLETRDWGFNKTRTLTASFPLGVMWHDSGFVGLVDKGLISISVVGADSSPLAPMGSGRQKVASKAFEAISGMVLPEALYEEISEWGYSVSVEKLVEEGITSMMVVIKDEVGTEVLRYQLSAWSGNVFRKGEWVRFCSSESSLKEISDLIKEDFEAHLEAVTAAA